LAFYLEILFAVFLIVASHFEGPFRFLPEIPTTLTKQIFVAPPPKIEYFAFGFQMPVADSLWIRAIQDFDYCETEISANVCAGNSWLYQMLDTITNLAPDYQVAYRTGALALTILISDFSGASKIFDKGVAVYPKDRSLLYAAAYHAMFEEKNNTKAAELLIRSAQNGGNDWFYNLAARLYADSGQRDLAIALYRSLEKTDIPPGVLKRMRDKIGRRYLKEPTK
jgi:tetratricopeptide (TPR) repeat protein